MDACLLTAEEVGQLVNYGIDPSHENHIHVPAEEAIKGIHEEEYLLVKGKHGRNYITTAPTYFLRRTPSGGPGGIHIVQRIKSNHLKHLKPVI
jgi:hypothetical protein